MTIPLRCLPLGHGRRKPRPLVSFRRANGYSRVRPSARTRHVRSAVGVKLLRSDKGKP